MLLAGWAIAFNADMFAQEPRDVANPREMLQVMQIDKSLLRFLQDDRPIVEDEKETLLQILFRLPRFSQVDVDRWSQPIEDWNQVNANPDSYRYDMFDIRGQVLEINRRTVLRELVPRLRFKEYYEVRVRNDDAEFLVFVREIPDRWQSIAESTAAEIEGQGIGESIRLQALLLKRGALADQPLLTFAAARVQWYPTRPRETMGISADSVLLAQLGVDISLLSKMKQKAAIDAADRECFYQSLAAVRLAKLEQLAKVGRRQFDIARMIQTPARCSGELYSLSGLARRAILIHVEDADVQTRFGLDHYYEIEVFLALEKQVRFVDESDAEGKLFTEYPFVVCVPELPPGMEAGDDIRVPVSFSGFFLKLWAYRTEFMSGGQGRTAKPKLQLSPLLIGPGVSVTAGRESRESQLDLMIAVVFVGMLFAAWWWLWRASVQDRLQAKKLFRKHDPPEGGLQTLGD